jgi:hypothetical protein
MRKFLMIALNTVALLGLASMAFAANQLDSAALGYTCLAVALGITGSVVLEESRTFVIPVQSVECPNPDVSQIVFTAGSHEVGRDAVRVLCVVFKDFDGSVGLYMVQPFFPAANP